MELRALTIDEAAREQARGIVAYAAEHIYRPFSGSEWIPGDDPGHVGFFDTYRAVFTFTEDPAGRRYRQLSVSVPGEEYPNPYALYTIAQELFGFSGWDQISYGLPRGWQAQLDKDWRAVIVAQRVAKAASAK